MADTVPVTTTAENVGPRDELEREAILRLVTAREWKNRRLLDFKESYFFLAPSRQRQLSSQTAPSTQFMLDEPELNTDFGFIICADFITEIVNTYMPEAQIWCERGPGMDLPEGVYTDEIADQVRKDDRRVFGAIKSSNFYAELPKAFNPDLAIGTAAIWVHRPVAHTPIECKAIPLRDLEINLGPNGEIDDRFVIHYARNSYVQKLLGPAAWAAMSDEHKRLIKAKPTDRSELRWGFWRKWEDIGDEVWQHVVMFGDTLLYSTELRGEGSCPLIVMRFGATADWPWAIGPMQQGLPTMRQMDEFERMRPEAVERAINPAIKYPDDGVTNIEQGIEPGCGYPFRQGGGQDFGPIYQQPPLDPVLMEIETKEHRLRKLFYVDHPEQTGDTPPTLGQWLDELARMQRRIGTAGYSFWREGPMKIFLRYKFLLEKSGAIKPITDKQGRYISTQPYNPAQRAAEQQEIATATQAMQIGGQGFPEEWKIAVDGTKTIDNIIRKMRVQNIIAMRSNEDKAKVVDQLAKLAMARKPGGGAEPAEGAGPPAAAP